MKKINTITGLGLIAVMFPLLMGPFAQIAYAAAITSASDTLSSQKVSTLANHDIQFTSPTGVAASATIIITFPADFSIAAAMDFTDMDVLDDTVNVTLAAAPSGTTWGAVRTSATVVTLTNGTAAVAAASVIRIKIGTNATNQSTGVRQITNTTTTGSKVIAISGTFTDTGNITVNILADDQVAVTATVDQSLTFTINDVAVGFGSLSTSAACFASPTPACSGTEIEAHTLIVGTNASNGFTMTVQGATLTAGAFTITAIGGTNSASSVGTEQFGLRMTATGGVGTVTSPYAAAGFAYAGTASTASQVASATGASANTTYSVRYIANIASNTEAGAYTATLTYVTTANF